MKRTLTFLAACLITATAFADVTLTDRGSLSRAVEKNTTQGTSAERRAARLAKRANSDTEKLRHKGHPSPANSGPCPPGTDNCSVTLIDAGGMQYFINTDITFSTTSSASGAASEASYTHSVAASTSAGGTTMSTLNDAYDGYNTMCVSLTGSGPCSTGDPTYEIYNQNGAATLDATCANRQIIYPIKSMLGGTINAHREVYVPTDDQFIRWVNYFTNTSGAPVTFNMIVANNLGSDSNTIVVSSSNGDNVAQLTDTWISSFQNFSGNTSSDPRQGHVLQGTGATTPLTILNFVDGDDNPYWGYAITLAPGETKGIMNFNSPQPTKAAANMQAARLATLPSTTKSCISTASLAEISNFVAGSADLSVTKTSPASVTTSSSFSYTINVANAGPDDAATTTLTDVLPAGVTFSGISTPGGWTCTTPTVGTNGTVTCTTPTFVNGGTGAFTLNVNSPATATTLSNTATISSVTSDPTPGNNSATASTTVASGATVSGTKSAPGGIYHPGDTVVYTVTLNNAGPGPQGDNPGNEFTDTLPAGINVVGASASSGTAVANTGTNTVTWNGAIPAGGNVVITITAHVGNTSGGTITNQGTISYDSDGNGTNDATALTQNVGGAGGPTPIVVVGPTVPTLSPLGLLFAAMLLAAVGAVALKSRM